MSKENIDYRLETVEMVEKLHKTIYNQDQKIADLEAKLAESELKYNATNRAYWELVEKQDNAFLQYEKLIGENAQLKQQLAEKDRAIENWQTMYESVVQTCHNDAKEIDRLNKQIAQQEHTIANLVEDNRASQEWYKKQLAEKEKESLKYFNEYTIWKNKCNLLEQDQDKISFAVEQLTQFEQEVLNYVDKVYGGIEDILDKEDLDYILDNQIKKIKGNKDE